MCAGHNTRSGVKLSNGPVRRTQIAELTLSPPLLRPRTDARLSDNSNITQPFLQPLHNRFPTPAPTNPFTTVLQPPRNREPITTTPQSFPNHIPAARSHQTDDPALGKHPRLNRPSCRIQELHDLDTTIPHPSCPKADQQLSPCVLYPDSPRAVLLCHRALITPLNLAPSLHRQTFLMFSYFSISRPATTIFFCICDK